MMVLVMTMVTDDDGDADDGDCVDDKAGDDYGGDDDCDDVGDGEDRDMC